MVQLKVAVLDKEREYLKQLTAYLVKKRESFFKVWTFWDIETYQRAAEAEMFDALLVTGAFLENMETGEIQSKIILFRKRFFLRYVLFYGRTTLSRKNGLSGNVPK